MAALLALGACSDLLEEEPDSFLTTGTFYQTSNDLNAAVTAVYRSINGIGWSAIEMASDQARHDIDEPTPNVITPDYLDYNPAQGAVTGAWNNFYDAVFRANLALDRAPGISMPDAQKTVLVAETKFLRSLAYLRLVQLYGDAPLLLSEVDHQKPDITRTPAKQVLDQVVKDLIEAEAALPATRPANQWGRARKAAAQMALAETFLWRSATMNTNEWQQASDWAKQVVDATATYGLNTDYIGTFLPSNKGNREMIFVITSTGVNARSSIGMVNNFYPRDLPFSGGGGFGLIHPTAWHLGSYAPGDYRGSVGRTGEPVAWRTNACTPNGSQCVNIKDAPMAWKYRPTSFNSALGDVDLPIYRYAEALLIYAEAQNEVGNTATAIQAVNQVRARARRGTGSESRAQPADLPTGLTKLQAREAIYMERNWELAFEQKRWLDLKRRDGIEPGYWRSQLQAHDPNASRRAPIADFKKLWPVPQDEIQNMPSLTQNPGY